MTINLSSTRLAFVLIAVLVLFLVLSAIIPQRDISEDQLLDWQEYLGDNYVVIDKLGLDRIYFTPTFFIVLGLLGVNLLFGNIKRFRSVYQVERTLLKTRHLGSILFHFSLILIMVAVILNFLYKYHSVLAMTEGQTLKDRPESYHHEFHGPLYDNEYGRFTLSLTDVLSNDDASLSLGNVAAIAVQSARAKHETEVSTNHPFELGELQFHYGLKSGYSPEFFLTDSAGNDLFRSFVRVANRKEEGKYVHRDFIVVPEDNLHLEIEVNPDSIGPDIAYRITALQDSVELYAGSIGSNDTVGFAGYKFTVPRLRQWCYIDVVKSPYLNLVFFGFWSALAGLTLSFVSRLKRAKAA
ncbi:MAG: cytochrome c biogenesis protein ResB [candidate division Zixibacteria bacterium]|nr:cytochrome c biogenesis protein ResB [candidate division Zixibacteria bacterium]MDH3936970.1 cytochrome c biogenesis protein ResB [candidate division Zixibacteria bacterium]MDH4032791.1 cytochrome c biogenesis protein ResB [candidate division Zixibacteria bacterium]